MKIFVPTTGQLASFPVSSCIGHNKIFDNSTTFWINTEVIDKPQTNNTERNMLVPDFSNVLFQMQNWPHVIMPFFSLMKHERVLLAHPFHKYDPQDLLEIYFANCTL